MPILTALTHIQQLLDGYPLPGTGGSTLIAVIEPPDPQVDQVNPVAYVWPTEGPENRESLPRPQNGTPGTGSTQAGWKHMGHNVDVWVKWFKDQGDPTPGLSFPTIMDAVMDAIRVSTDGIMLQDPVTFRYSQLYAVGERMKYDIATPMATKDQRTLEYNGLVRVTFDESFQA